jgi:DNA repair protein RadC
MHQAKLAQMARTLLYRRRLAAAADLLENKIRAFLLKKGRQEIIDGGFKISLKADGQIEVKEVSPPNPNQPELPLNRPEGGSTQEQRSTKIDIVKVQMVKDGSIEYGKNPISNPRDLAELGFKFLKNADREMFLLVCLNNKNFVNCLHLVTIGTLDRAFISPREILKTALLANAAAIAFIHNHPSGDPQPSAEDVHLTKSLETCADLFGIRVLDHVIVGDNGRYESFSEKKMLTPPK